MEFITLVSSEANEISEKEAKKTIACDHITKALEQLGFADYVPAVLDAAAEHKEVQKVRRRRRGVLCRTLTTNVSAGPREESKQVPGKRPITRGVGAIAAGAVCPGSCKTYVT